MTPPAISGNLSLRADGTFTVQIASADIGFSASDQGTYTVSGSILTLRYQDGSSESAVIADDSNSIVFSESEAGETVTATFRR
jgi:hypothetical protein